MNVDFDNLQIQHSASTLLELNDYYPYGLLNPWLSTTSALNVQNNYKYNGKELQTDIINAEDYGARHYDAVLGRWTGMDSKSELLEMATQFSYALDNPINFIDKDGELPIFINGKVDNDNERGNASYWDYQILRTVANSGIPNPGGEVMYVDGDRSLSRLDDPNPEHIRNGNLSDGNSPGERKNAGFTQGVKDFQKILSMLEREPKTGKIIEKIQIYTHSRGTAFGIGYTEGLLAMIKQYADEFEDPNNVIDFVYNMAPHQSNSLIAPEGVNEYSQDHTKDVLSGNDMKGLKAAFTTNETAKGAIGSHSTSSFVKDLGAFLKAFQSSKGDSNKLIDDFVKTMSSYGIKVTVK